MTRNFCDDRDYEQRSSGLLVPKAKRILTRGGIKKNPEFFAGPGFFSAGGGASSDPYFGQRSLGLHFNGADATTLFQDNSHATKALTVFGNAQIDTAQSVFGGSSGLFDGTGDYIAAPNSPDFDFAAGDFTIAMRVRFASVAGNSHLIGKYAGNPTSPFAIYRDTTNIRFYASSNGTTWNLVSGQLFGTGFAINTWYALEVTRNGNTYRTFLNGVLVASTTIAGTLHLNAGTVTIGSNNSGAEGHNGHIDELLIYKGVALHTADFTPASVEFVDPPVASLLHFNGADTSTVFTDSALVPKTWTGFGNAQIDTGISKYGGASLLLDGTGDYVDSAASSDYTIGTGDFTVEFWNYAALSTGTRVLFDLRPTGVQGAYPTIYSSGTSLMYFQSSADRITGAAAITAGVFQHIELNRIAGTTRLFVNGVQIGASYADTTNYLGTRIRLGASGFDSATLFAQGNIDDFRIRNGSGFHSATFTPPSAELPNP